MSFTKILQKLSAGYSFDIQTNFINIFRNKQIEGVEDKLFYMIALTMGYAIANEQLLNDIRSEVKSFIDDKQAEACKLASVMMAMNNTYYGAIYDALENDEMMQMQSGLEMQKLVNPGIDIGDFEALCLAVSIHSKCKKCISIHTNKLLKRGFSLVAIRDITRIVAVLKGAAQVYAIGAMRTYDFIVRDENL